MNPSTLPNLDGLLDLACRDGVDIRPTLLRVLTDLYVQKPAHTAEEEAQYVELALGLIEAVDATTCTAVMASLSRHSSAPAAVLGALTAIQPASPETAAAETTSAPDDLVETFFSAGANERRLILMNLDAAAGTAPRRPVLGSNEIIRRLENAALQHNIGEFSRVLERSLGIGRGLAERIARDPSGEPVVIAAKAYGIQPSVLQRILLFINPAIGQSVERIHELAGLYNELTPQAAIRMIDIWRNGSTRTLPPHEPMHWDDERRSARSLPTPGPHRVSRDRERLPSRSKINER